MSDDAFCVTAGGAAMAFLRSPFRLDSRVLALAASASLRALSASFCDCLKSSVSNFDLNIATSPLVATILSLAEYQNMGGR